MLLFNKLKEKDFNKYFVKCLKFILFCFSLKISKYENKQL